jgi:heme oxygenase
MAVTADGADAGTTFSEQLREASWAAHERAADTAFMRALLAGELPIERYAELTAQQYLAYLVIEEAARTMAADPVAAAFVHPALHRVPALEADLHFLLGAEWRARVAPNAATQTYVARLREVCFDWPGGFVAHHYVRYMGDLSGGQFIRRVVRRNYDLEGLDGTSFYDFSALDDLDRFKQGYRQCLDRAPWSVDEQRRVVDEILLAYQLNTDVLDALA